MAHGAWRKELSAESKEQRAKRIEHGAKSKALLFESFLEICGLAAEMIEMI